MVFPASPPGAKLNPTGMSEVPTAKKLTATPVAVAVAAFESTILGDPATLETVVFGGMPAPTTTCPSAMPVALPVMAMVLVLFNVAVVASACCPMTEPEACTENSGTSGFAFTDVAA